LKHREFAKQKMEAEAGEKVDLKHGVCVYMSKNNCCFILASNVSALPANLD